MKSNMTTSAVRKIFELIDENNMSLEDQRKFAEYLEKEKPINSNGVEELYLKFIQQI